MTDIQAQCVSSPEKTLLVTCFQIDTTATLGNQLIGHAFASVWDYSPSSGDPANHDSVGWVT
ncbi:hypothetical protein AZE42_09553 [Rhizopogon vesiculosus]|uniref:Uncharacterized protein n=1 Tax=Rhizopogon vesiculosus TaxID=180088 RepID=A0A1J8QP62_9AGAM|nr:hypothetical protein AZE42_09553 [Rhizopogon vesiculosus]